jgi:hypothetical protein
MPLESDPHLPSSYELYPDTFSLDPTDNIDDTLEKNVADTCTQHQIESGSSAEGTDFTLEEKHVVDESLLGG